MVREIKPQSRQTRPGRRPVQHRRKRKGISARKIILALLLIMLAGEAVYAVLKLPWFEISAVRVYGRKLTPAEFVAGCTKTPPKSNIFLFKTRNMVAKLQRSPIIEQATVSRGFPNTLVVRITERRADFVLSTHRKYYEVDAGGLPFRIVPRPNPKLPELACKVPKPITLGKPIKTSAFISATNCLRLARGKKNFRVRKITVDQSNDLCLNVQDGLLIRLGRPQHIEDKLDKAERTMELVPDLEYIDVTCPEAPALKPSQSGSNPS